MSLPRIVYLLLAVAGIVMTWKYNLQFMAESGGAFDLGRFIADSSMNAASQSLSWDLAIACIAGVFWIYMESKRLGLRFFWLYILLAFGVAFAFAFPLFLYVRQTRLEALDKPAN